MKRTGFVNDMAALHDRANPKSRRLAYKQMSKDKLQHFKTNERHINPAQSTDIPNKCFEHFVQERLPAVNDAVNDAVRAPQPEGNLP